MVTRKLTEVLTEYLAKHQRLKWTTRDSASRAWNKLIKAKDDMPVSLFDYRDAEDFQEHLFNEGLAPGAVRSNMKMVRPIMNWAKRRGYRSGDPFEDLKLPRVAKREIRVYSDAELSAILEAANLIWRARIVASVSAGLRRSEGLNLTIADIDFEQSYIKVQGKRNTRETWPWTPKSYECRRVPLTDYLANLFLEIMAELPPGYPYLLLTEKRYWGLQQLRSRGKMSPRVMLNPDENNRPWRKIRETTGIQGTFHDLRRTCISKWSWELAPQEVQKLAGHADIKTTLEYYSAIRADVLQRAKQIGATGLEPATS